MLSLVYFKDKKIAELEYPIQSFLDLGDKYVILLSVSLSDNYPENVFCFNKKGEMLWQIEKAPMPDGWPFYNGVQFINEMEIYVYALSIERVVDLNSGKILRADFVK
jgi:hypothetical protein